MEKIVFESPRAWVQVIETPRKYYYLRRKNKDSVAVFLLRRSTEFWEVLIRMQPLPIHTTDRDLEHQLFPCPITGGLEENESPEDCAARETYEESGYSGADLKSLGTYIVGTQTDELVHIYWKDVTGLEPDEALQDGSYFESISRNEWKPLTFLEACTYSGCLIGYLKLLGVLNLAVHNTHLSRLTDGVC